VGAARAAAPLPRGTGSAIFRLPEHLRRLELSAKIYRMELPFSTQQIGDAIHQTILGNGFEACYIRPLAYRGFGSMGVNPLRSPVEMVIACWPWGKYLGEQALTEGVDVCVSSWRRPSSSTLPSMAKATGNYINSQLIKMEAITNGFVEGIALDAGGYVSEGSGENLFLVQDGAVLTPPLSASLLPGITRDAVITLARDIGIEVREQVIPRGMLYTCDELFLTGTAAEITAIRSVDRIPVGAGRPGEITLRVAAEFMGLVEGALPDRHGWLTPVLRAPDAPEIQRSQELQQPEEPQEPQETPELLAVAAPASLGGH
jgi:branched-chain amino acid aminotransferase